MHKLLPIVLLIAAVARGQAPLPNQTYFADPLRSIFPAGNFNAADGDHPRGWSDLEAFTQKNASIEREFLQLQNSDAAKTVHVQTLVPVDPQWRWIAVSAVLFGKNLKLSDSPDAFVGVQFDILDKEKKLITRAAQLSPLLSGKYTGQKARLASFALPDNAAFLAVTPQLALATGSVDVARIVIMPADPDKEPDPSKVAALHRFIKAGNVEGVKTLIGGDKKMLESRNNDYDAGTPLIGAAWEGQAEVAQVLLDMGADAQATDENYRTTGTYWAAYWGRPGVLKILFPLTKDTKQELLQGVKVGRSRNHKNTPDEDFQTCADYLSGGAGASTATQPSSMP